MWKELKEETQKDYFKNIIKILTEKKDILAPEPANVFRAFNEVPFEDVKIVILGQDPYPTPGDANGLAFAVNENIKVPKSLQNIFKEIEKETGVMPTDKTLLSWTNQGVLLLNTCLTTEKGKTFAHKNLGWGTFTDKVISVLNERQDPVIFMLWGKPSQKKAELITSPHHYVLNAPHPSPLSAHTGWWGCNHFTDANKILKSLNKDPIVWAK